MKNKISTLLSCVSALFSLVTLVSRSFFVANVAFVLMLLFVFTACAFFVEAAVYKIPQKYVFGALWLLLAIFPCAIIQ